MLRTAVPAALAAAGVDPADVIGIGTDFTACTVLPTTADGTPLCELPEFADRPHAYVKLWKHHAAQPQADRINALADERGEPWLPRYGGLISSEWEFAKGLQVLEEDPEVYARDASAGSRPPTGSSGSSPARYVRNACTAGYKGILPGRRATRRADFLAALNPGFADFVADKLEHADRPARRPRRRADRARPRRGPGCRRASRSRSATSTRTSPRRPRRRSSPARWSRSWAPPPATS